jgi:hygromycin-B 4-O-kinase
METIDAIHHVDVSDTSGYGVIGDNGVGLSSSWHNSLQSILKEEEDWDFYGRWHVLFETTFLERGLFNRTYVQMVRLLDFCPEKRFLVHSGCGFGNVMVHEGRITGILDWIDARYGDFIYDIAWLDLWDRESHFPERFQRFYVDRGITVEHYTERLHCYQLYMGLDALRFFAKTQQRDSYKWIRQRISPLLLSF